MGETHYHENSTPVLLNDNFPYDKIRNPIKVDDYGLNGEGLVALKDGTFWAGDEYGPHIAHFENNGVEMGRINTFKDDSRDLFHLSAVFQDRCPNRGMEG